MFGLMRAGFCSRHHKEQAYQRRLHYCGTCKTMGRLYGQKSRILLNNDVVFFAELLTALSPDTGSLKDWNASYQSYNCFSLPSESGEMPLALRIAAAATLVMSEFKLADQLEDGGQSRWKFAQRIYSQSFLDASRRMKEWGFPIEKMWQWYQAQRGRETEAASGTGAGGVIQTLEFVAEPTAMVTGWTFQHGAAAIGAAEETQQNLAALGAAFGRLVYVLDAWDDFDQDAKRGEFNALSAAFGVNRQPNELKSAGPIKLPDACAATTHAYLNQLASEVSAALQRLPLPDGKANLFASRLRTNLVRRLKPKIQTDGPPFSHWARRIRAAFRVLLLPLTSSAYAVASGGAIPAHAMSDEPPIAPAAQMPGSDLQAGTNTTASTPVRRRGPNWSSNFCCCDGLTGCDCCCIACDGTECCCSSFECAGCCGDGCCSACECGSCCG